MKRFAARVGRFFWSGRFLKVALWTSTVIILFYAEEDWRGARAWAATKREWEARGQSFDFQSYFAPPIPGIQNLGEIPLFQLSQAGDAKHPYLDDVALRKAMESVWCGDDPRTIPNGWLWGQAPDLKVIRASLSSAYLKKFSQASRSVDPLTQFEALNPYLAEIREASAHRPLCRFEYDNTQAMPAARGLGLVTSSIMLSKVLAYHAILALDEHRPDIALADFETAEKLGAAAGHDPSLVGGLVEIGVSAIDLEIVYQGLTLHAWSDAELVEVDRELASADFLSVFRFCMSAEAAISPADFEWYKHHPTDLKLALEESEADSWIPEPPLLVPFAEFYNFLDVHWQAAYRLWPAGWFDLNKSLGANSILRAREEIDLQAHRAYPNPLNDLNAQLKQTRNSLPGILPWKFLWIYILTPLTHEPVKFAYAQARIDEARVACALERYRLAHQHYPASLDALTPEYLAEMPRDIMTGQPYHYEVRPDGTFRLYSVGWNLKNEEGVQSFIHESYNTPGHPSPDLEHGDWPWPVLKTERSR